MFANAYIGLAVTSHNTNAMATARFSNIAITGAVTGAWQVQAIGPVQRTNDPAPLYVTVQDSAGKSKTISHPDPAATNLSTWQEWRIPLSEFSAGGVKMTAVKKLVIGVGDRRQPEAGRRRPAVHRRHRRRSPAVGARHLSLRFVRVWIQIAPSGSGNRRSHFLFYLKVQMRTRGAASRPASQSW